MHSRYGNMLLLNDINAFNDWRTCQEERGAHNKKSQLQSVGIYTSQAATAGYHLTSEAITLGYAVVQECNKNGLRALVAAFHSMWQLCPPFGGVWTSYYEVLPCFTPSWGTCLNHWHTDHQPPHGRFFGNSADGPGSVFLPPEEPGYPSSSPNVAYFFGVDFIDLPVHPKITQSYSRSPWYFTWNMPVISPFPSNVLYVEGVLRQDELSPEWWQWRRGLVHSAAAEVNSYEVGTGWGRAMTWWRFALRILRFLMVIACYSDKNQPESTTSYNIDYLMISIVAILFPWWRCGFWKEQPAGWKDVFPMVHPQTWPWAVRFFSR